jgi:glycosyltransferase involved in cell wall biosynthesis
MSEARPRLSVVLPTFNAERYVAETVQTVVEQSFEDWELVVVDGGSTDGTLERIRSFAHPNIHVVSEPDEGICHALDKGVERARGDFVTILCASDGYLDMNWFSSCVRVMDEDPEVSLVWGLPMIMGADGEISGLPSIYAPFLSRELVRHLSKTDWFWYWLRWGVCFPDGNMVVRANVYRRCTPRYRLGSRAPDLLMPFYLNFNQYGYLPVFVSTQANFGRIHPDQTQNKVAVARHLTIADYLRQVRRYRIALCRGIYQHVFRDGEGNPIGALPLFTDPSMANVRRDLLSIRYEDDPSHWSRDHITYSNRGRDTA